MIQPQKRALADAPRDPSSTRTVAGYLRCSGHDLPASVGIASGPTSASAAALPAGTFLPMSDAKFLKDGPPVKDGPSVKDDPSMENRPPRNEACTTILAEWRAMRQAELIADAAAAGETITAWYEDFAVSGMGQAEGRRSGFRRLQQDARAGLLRSVYMRDLSRAFRDLLQQELWFADMERWGVAVHAQDLASGLASGPASGLSAGGDADMRRLLRQQVGSVHEYYSRRLGALWQAARMQSFEEGRWVGRATSCWGLHYDPLSGGFQADPETAAKAVFVFEAFAASAGVARRTAALLNTLHAAGAPGATLAPTGTSWKTNLVLNVVRSCLYRRRTSLVGAEREAPELIPPVIPAGLLAQVDALLADRQPLYDRCRLDCEAGRRGYTLRGLIRCRACAGVMQAIRADRRYPRGASMWASWECTGAALTRSCKANLSVPQGRALALVCRGVRQALEEHGLDHPWVYGGTWASAATAWLSEAERAVRREVRGWQRAEARQRLARAACLQAYAEGVISDVADLRARLEALDGERGAWKEARQRFTPPDVAALDASPADVAVSLVTAADAGVSSDADFSPRHFSGPAAYGRWRRCWHKLGEQELRGHQDLFSPLHPGLRTFLQGMGAGIEVEMGDRPRKATDKVGSTRRHSGLLTLVLRLPRLDRVDRVLTLTETQEDLQHFGQWRSEQIKAGNRMKDGRR